MSIENEIRRLVRQFPRTRRKYRKRHSGARGAENVGEEPRGMGMSEPPRLPLSCSVVICTRDRPEELAQCLDSVVRLRNAGHEVIVVDNAPSSTATRDLVESYREEHQVRYVLESRPGLDIARNRGVLEAKGEVVAFTDDDCIVDANWLNALVRNYDNPEVACVTGLVAPWEVETRAQEVFEFHYGGMSRGLTRFTVDFSTMRATAAGRLGAGANMSFRRGALLAIGLFNEALDCGMPTKSGGDSYAFYKVMAEGYGITYDPSAVVWHRHRRDYEHLRKQIFGYGAGISSHLIACLVEDHDLSALATLWDLLRYWHFARLRKRLQGQIQLSLLLLLTELWGTVVGPWAYFRAKRIAAKSRHLCETPVCAASTLSSSLAKAESEENL